jgi:hypothetical protein
MSGSMAECIDLLGHEETDSQGGCPHVLGDFAKS